MTPAMVHGEVQQMAYDMVINVPESARRGELLKLRDNPTMHALVLKYMDELRRDFARQGKAILMQQEQAASADRLPSPNALGAEINLL